MLIIFLFFFSMIEKVILLLHVFTYQIHHYVQLKSKKNHNTFVGCRINKIIDTIEKKNSINKYINTMQLEVNSGTSIQKCMRAFLHLKVSEQAYFLGKVESSQINIKLCIR